MYTRVEIPQRSYNATRVPSLHVPTGREKYNDADDVETHALNRPIFKALSKATLWHALNETDNNPDPRPTAAGSRRLSSVGYGGGQTTLISAEAQEEAERDCKVGIKRVVFKSLKSTLVQERRATLVAGSDFPGP